MSSEDPGKGLVIEEGPFETIMEVHLPWYLIHESTQSLNNKTKYHKVPYLHGVV